MSVSDRALRVLYRRTFALFAALLLTAAAPPQRIASASRNMETNSVVLMGSASCDYCTDEVAELVSLHTRKRGVKITAFLEGSPADVRNACARRRAAFPCVAVSMNELLAALRTGGGTEPLIYVRSATGKITTFSGSTSLRRLTAALEDR